MSQLRTGGAVGGGTEFTFVTPEPYSSKLPELYSGCGPEAYPKWYPNRAGERTLSHFRDGEPVERFVSIDMYRRAPTARPGQIIFDHGRPNDGYYLQRNGCMKIVNKILFKQFDFLLEYFRRNNLVSFECSSKQT